MCYISQVNRILLTREFYTLFLLQCIIKVYYSMYIYIVYMLGPNKPVLTFPSEFHTVMFYLCNVYKYIIFLY